MNECHNKNIFGNYLTTYRKEYRPMNERATYGWEQYELRTQTEVKHEKVTQSCAPNSIAPKMTTKRYSLPNVTLSIPVKCCCDHPKDKRDTCQKETALKKFNLIHCCGSSHVDDDNYDNGGHHH